MKRKIGVVSALAVVASNVGMPESALSQGAASIEQQCQYYEQISDPLILQQELTALLDSDPNSACVDFIVDLLGGPPVAQVDPQALPY